MARLDTYTLTCPATLAAGPALSTRDLRPPLSVQLVGVTAASATVQVEGSLDGVNFAKLNGDIAADAIVTFDVSIVAIRLRRTAGDNTGGIGGAVAGIARDG